MAMSASTHTIPAIACKGVTRQFGPLIAVNNIDLTIPKGQFTAILGPNGAGKTTFIEMLEGIQFPNSGSISLLGKQWHTDHQLLRESIGLSLQETHFMERLTVRETAKLFAGFYGFDEATALERIDEVGLSAKLDDRVGPLSGGQKQKLALAIALLPNPEILFLDEPTTGLDPSARRDLWQIVQSLRKRDATLVLTTHYLEEAEHLCDWIVIFDRGQILAQGTVADLIERYTPGDAIIFRIPDPAAYDWTTLPNIDSCDIRGQTVTLNVASMSTVLPSVFEVLTSIAQQPISFEARRASLEDVFLTLTGRRLDEDT